jgi:hypothetical protein
MKYYENTDVKIKFNIFPYKFSDIEECMQLCINKKFGSFSTSNNIAYFNNETTVVCLTNLQPAPGINTYIPIPFINDNIDPNFQKSLENQKYLNSLREPTKPWFIPGNYILDNSKLKFKKPGYCKINTDVDTSKYSYNKDYVSLIEYVKQKAEEMKHKINRDKYKVTTYKNEELIVEELDDIELMILTSLTKTNPNSVNCIDYNILKALGLKTDKPKVAIIFFGLTKNLSDVYDNLKEYVFDEITNNGLEYDIFIHTYNINGKYINKWTGEESNYNNNAYKILNANHVLLDNQDDVIKNLNFEDYYSKEHLGDWVGCTCEGMNTEDSVKYLIRNLMLALYSKKKVTEEFEKYKDDYEYVILMRPDLKFEKKINPVKIMSLLNDDNMILPVKDTNIGCNDRLCISKPNNVIYYGKLFDQLLDYSKKKPIVSEVYLLDMLKEKNIKIIFDEEILFDTIRVDGTTGIVRSKRMF